MGGGNAQSMICKQKKSSILMSFPSSPYVVSISFRNKGNGWKNYYMEIRIK